MTDIRLDGSHSGQPDADAPPPMRITRTPFRRWFRTVGWRHLVGLAALAFALFPVLFVVSSSLNPAGTLGGSTLIPSDISLINYRDLLNGTDAPYLDWLFNTLFVAGGAAILGYALKGPRLALFVGFTYVYIAVFGQWEPSMETLSFVLIAAPLSVLLGLLLGI